MFSLSGWAERLSLAVSLAAYVVGTAFAAAVTGYGVHRVGIAMVDAFAPRPATIERKSPLGQRPAAPPVRRQTMAYEGALMPTSERWSRGSMGASPTPFTGARLHRVASGAQFGSSSRSTWRRRSFFDWDDDEDERPEAGSAFRTVCVRLCDGFYFPISFSATPERFDRDRQICERSCGAEARLFVYPNPGGVIEDMTDLQGRPYRHLRTAFLYRSEYVPSCKCQPHPWEAESRDRHRTYELAAKKRKGNRQAAKELEALEAKLRQAARNARTAARPVAGDGEQLQRLGVDGSPRRRPEREARRATRSPDADWRRRILRPDG